MSPRRWHLASFLGVWILAGAYLALRADRSWIPHDEGLIAQAAERLLEGELAHRDFDDTYTGGLNYLHALAFQIWGVHLKSLRFMLLVFALAFIPTVYRVAARAAGPLESALATLLCVAWSLPVYFASMPSWYNLFFAVFGTLALLRYIESPRAGWLFVAGLCGGLSCLAKVVGLFYVAGALMFFLYRDQAEAAREAAPQGETLGRRLYCLVVAGAVVVFWMLNANLVLRRPSPAVVFHFLVPGIAVGLFLLWSEYQLGAGPLLRRLRRVAGMVAPFLLGFALPITVFLLPYIGSSALGDLWNGLFVAPQTRFALAFYPPPPLSLTLVAASPIVFVLAVALRKPVEMSPDSRGGETVLARLALGLMAVFIVGIAFFGDQTVVYRLVWLTARPAVPLVTLAGCWALAAADRRGDSGTPDRQKLFLLLAVTALFSLVQFPAGFAIYFCYMVPLAILAFLFLRSFVGRRAAGAVRVDFAVWAFYFLFAVLWLHRGLALTVGERFWQVDESAVLEIDRGALRSTPRLTAAYEELVTTIQAHSAPGAAILATPDCPQVYFLSARKNPTRTIYDIFDPDYTSPGERTKRLLRRLDEQSIDLVVLHRSPLFSEDIRPELETGIRERYPFRKEVLPFTVYWRDP